MKFLLRRLAGDPLIHFFALGAVIFGAYAWTHPQQRGDHEIVVGETELTRIRAEAKALWGKDLDTQQLQGLVDAYLHEEVLVREALALGLDREDTVVRRRLVQKMEFLAQQDVRTPNDSEIRAWFESHPNNYLVPESLTWEQRFFNGPQSRQKAVFALNRLRTGIDVPGDRFMLPVSAVAQDRVAIARDYGEVFAQAVWSLPLNQWSGPLDSPHGTHLVRLRERSAAKPATFDSVSDKVKADLLNHRIAQARDAAYKSAMAQYRVALPPGISINGSVANLPQP